MGEGQEKLNKPTIQGNQKEEKTGGGGVSEGVRIEKKKKKTG